MAVPYNPPPSGEGKLAKYLIIGIAVTVLNLLLDPYLVTWIDPYAQPAGLLLFLVLGVAVGYFVASRRRSGYVPLVLACGVLGIAAGWELGTKNPHLLEAILASCAGALVS